MMARVMFAVNCLTCRALGLTFGNLSAHGFVERNEPLSIGLNGVSGFTALQYLAICRMESA
jgi:hypothetical protein